MKSLHQVTFLKARRHLARELTKIRSEKDFWKNFRELRGAAFEIEFLAKFYRKARGGADHGAYVAIIRLVKPLEDRLGALDDADAMIPYCERHGLSVSLTKRFSSQRLAGLRKLRQWMKAKGWTDGRALKHLDRLMTRLHWLESADEIRDYAREHMAVSLKKLQAAINNGDYDPTHSRRRGYRMTEIEPRVHKLRRDIRKQTQYMQYTGGIFALTGPRAFGFNDRFSRLPRARIALPLKVERAQLQTLNRYVFELGAAKDWALRLERLRKAGLHGVIDFDQLDVTLGTWRGRPTPFNALVLGILREIRRTRPFAHMQTTLAR